LIWRNVVSTALRDQALQSARESLVHAIGMMTRAVPTLFRPRTGPS
jgi:hypothetical protein